MITNYDIQVNIDGKNYPIIDAEAQKSLVYSQNETDTGKIWIDGKKIYRKVVNCGYLLKDDTLIVKHNIENINKIIKVNGIGYQDGGDCLPIPYIYNVPQGQGSISLYANKTSIEMVTYGDRTDVRVLITLEYTKTTN